MAKLTSFATGVGSGYLAGERLKKTEARQKRQDDILEKYLTSGDASMKKDPMSSTMFDPETGGTMNMTTGRVTFHPSDIDDLDERKRMRGMANGGMVQPMPQHLDKMSWQRQTFKK